MHVVATYMTPKFAAQNCKGRKLRIEQQYAERYGCPFLCGFTFFVTPHYKMEGRSLAYGTAWVPELELLPQWTGDRAESTETKTQGEEGCYYVPSDPPSDWPKAAFWNGETPSWTS